MARCIATVCLSGTLEDKLSAAAEAGFDGVEIFEADLVGTRLSPEEVRRRCADLGLSVGLYQPFRDFEAVPKDMLTSNLRRAEAKFDILRALGTDTLLVCSSVAREAVDDDDLAAEQLNALAERAARHGLRIAYEALAWGRFVSTWDHSWDIVRRADHPALGLCLDSFHILSRDGDPARIAAEVPGGKIFFLQLADAPVLALDVMQWSRHHRVFPGQGAFDLPAFTRQVLATGYAGPLSLEVFNDVFRQSDPWRAAVDAMRSLLFLEEQLGRPAAPRAPHPSGVAFTELAVDEATRTPVSSMLNALGFTPAGRHRTKAVELWQQGATRVLLNSAAAGPTRIAALGLTSTDPARSARRAAALLAPPAETDLLGVTAPDGTQMLFCAAEPTLPGFPRAAATGPALLTGTDHVAFAQPFDHFDEAALFYRSVLGLELSAGTEFAAPFGLMHSQVARDPAGGVRIAFNGPLLRRGEWAPRVASPQHVAFATDDIFAAAGALRERTGPLLPIPDNYYADLDARLELAPALLATMREHGVLYDCDEHGEFFHFYTRTLGSRIFFEVLQRTGGYDGYGAVNTPVRMAAHRADSPAPWPGP